MPGTQFKMIKAASFSDLLSQKQCTDYGSMTEEHDCDQISSTTSASSMDDFSDDEDDYELCSRCGRFPKDQAMSLNQLPCLCKKNSTTTNCLSKYRPQSSKSLREVEKEKKRICERNNTKLDPCYFQVHSGVQVQMPELKEEDIDASPTDTQHHCSIFNAKRFGSFTVRS